MTLSPQLLAELAAVNFGISQHRTDPRDNEWFAGGVGPDGHIRGEVGPFESAEAALVGGVAWLVRSREEAEDDRRLTYNTLADTREALKAAKQALAAAQAELRAERAAQG